MKHFKKLEKESVENISSLSSFQEGLLYHYVRHSDESSYFVRLFLFINGDIVSDIFEESWIRIVEKNEMLRTVFRWQGIDSPIQITLKSNDFLFEFRDLSNQNISFESLPKHVDRTYAQNDINLTETPFKVFLYKLKNRKYGIEIKTHHILYDGWSNAILIKEFIETYGSLSKGRPVNFLPKVRFSEYVQKLKQANKKELHQYWENRLTGFSSITDLQDKFEKKTPYDVKINRARLKANVKNSLLDFSSTHRFTTASVLYTAWGILMQKLTNSSNFLFGTTVSGRNVLLKNIENTVGLFINTVPITVSHGEQDKFVDVVMNVNQHLIEREKYINCSLTELKNLASLKADEELFETLVVIENYPFDIERINRFDKLSVDSYEITDHNDYNLYLVVNMLEDVYELCIYYNHNLYSDALVQKIQTQLNRVIEGIVFTSESKVSDFQLITKEEKEVILNKFNDTTVDYPGDNMLHQLFSEQAQKTPKAKAVWLDGEAITYKELDHKSNQLARLFDNKRVKNSNVGILMNTSFDTIVSILGILKSGNAYVPIDSNMPENRILWMIKDAALTSIISEKKHVELLNKLYRESDLLNWFICLDSRNLYKEKSKHQLDSSDVFSLSGDHLDTTVDPEDNAYVIYTSGSTGTPKGVNVKHQGVVNYSKWRISCYNFTHHDVTLQLAPYNFDTYGSNLYSSLLSGGSLILIPHENKLEIQNIINVIRREGVTNFCITPMLYGTILDKLEKAGTLESLRFVVLAGEKASEAVLQKSKEVLPNVLLINEYGPTEASIAATYHKELNNKTSAIIGKPISNTQIYILGKSQELQPIGATGELCISGEGLARGYLNNVGLTKEKFIENPFREGERMYRTGDLGRWLPDGNIEFLGRLDDQVKIRGFRIELGEIESQLSTHEGVNEAVVMVKEREGGKYLVAYYVPNDSEGYTIKKILKTNKELPPSINLFEFSNGVSFYSENKKESQLLYEEIFLNNTYIKNGISIPPGGCVFDVGANIGMFSIYANLIVKDLEIYSFEPIPPIFELLKLNTSLYKGGFKLFNIGLSDRINNSLFNYFPQATTLSGISKDSNTVEENVRQYIKNTEGIEQRDLSENELNELLKERLTTEEFICQVTTVSNMISENNIKKIDLLKIDVENSELDVLMGINEKDWKKITQLVIEVHNVNNRLDVVRKLLTDKGYRVIVEQSSELENTNLYEVFALSKKLSIESNTNYIELSSKGCDGISKFNESLKEYLSDHLPDYMLPLYYVPMDSLPLTLNGKIDRKSMPDPEVSAGEDYAAPRTKEEKVLCEVWSKVLGIERIGIHDNFFLLGGDSIKSIQIGSRMRTSGYEVSVEDIFNYLTIAELALKLKEIASISDQSVVIGQAALTGIQRWFFEGNIKSKHHCNQSVMLNFAEGIGEQEVRDIFTQLQTHHDGLRMRYKQKGTLIIQEIMDTDFPVSLLERDLTKEKSAKEQLLSLCNDLQSGIDLEEGPLMKLGLFHMVDGSRLLIVIHHLVVDGISWRILFEDIEILYRQVKNKGSLQLPLKTDSFQRWSGGLQDYVQGKNYAKASSYWSTTLGKSHTEIKRDHDAGANTYADVESSGFRLSKATTGRLLWEVHGAFNTQINDILLAAFLLSVNKHYGNETLKIDLESHGREEILEGVDVSRTIGWFTSFYPVVLGHEGDDSDLSGLIKGVKESLRDIPNNGVDYLIGKYLTADSSIDTDPTHSSRIIFNYLGQFDSDTEGKVFAIAPEPTGNSISLDEIRGYDWEVSGMIRGGQLEMSLSYSEKQYTKGTMNSLMDYYKERLTKLIAYCSSYGKQELTPSDLTYKELTIAQLNELQGVYAVEDVYLLSPMQEGMLFHALFDKGGDHYFEQVNFCLRGTVDVAMVQRSFQSLVNRYDVLRTVFVHEGYDQPLQVVLKERELAFSYEDVRKEVGQSTRAEVLAKYRQLDKDKKFNLSEDPLMRVSVYRTGEKDYDFIWSYHHILMDGWCMSIIINEFKALYASYRDGKEISLPAIHRYSGYISWLARRDKEASEKYWEEYLADYHSLATLPKGEQLTIASRTNYLKTTLVLSKSQTRLLQKVSRRYSVTFNTIIQSAWGILLSRYNNTNDVIFGSVVSGRPAEIEGIETMVGLFINTIPVRISYNEGDSIGDLLKAVQQRAIESERHHYHPLSEIQSASVLGMGLLDHIIVFENYPIAEEIEGLEAKDNGMRDYIVTDVEVFEQTNYDLTITVVSDEEIRIIFAYNPTSYASRMIEGIKGHMSRVVDQVMTDSEVSISSVDILPEEERKQLLHKFNDTAAEYPRDKTVIDLFEAQVKKAPDKVALVFPDEEFSYGLFHTKVDRMALMLIVRGVKPGEIVGIMSERSFNLMIGIFAILKSGAAYLPIDPTYPEARINYILEDSGIDLVLVSTEFREKVKSSVELLDLDSLKDLPLGDLKVESRAKSGGLAYVIYTSGSTGSPKGVMVEHGSLMNRLCWMGNSYPLGEKDVILQKTTMVFDVSVWELFWWSQQGATLCLLNPGDEKDPGILIDVIEQSKVSTIHFVPSMLQAFLDYVEVQESQSNLNTLKQVFSSGEALKMNQATSFYKLLYQTNQTRLINLYGPTEATIDVSYYNCFDQSSYQMIPIGKPIDNISLYILDSTNGLQPIGVAGELCISGDGLAKGYMNNEELTKEKFIVNPFKAGERMYKTGDLARWLVDGNIEFLGRLDDQVKIRGHRIELGEIEHQLSCHEGIQETTVLTNEKEGDKFLSAYYVSEVEIGPKVLRSYLSERLPEYMLPSYYVHLESFPLTENGKVDKKSFPDPEINAGDDYVAPSNEIEERLLVIWSEILNLDKEVISIEKSFFELGGNSLKAVRVINHTNKAFGITIPLIELYNKSTVEELSEMIELVIWSQSNEDEAFNSIQSEKKETHIF